MEREPEVKKVRVKQERARKAIREVWRATRRKFSSEEKIRIVLEGLRGEETISELCRREGIAPTVYYRWRLAYENEGIDGLQDKPPNSLRVWNRLTQEEYETVVEQAILHPEEPTRQIAFMVTNGCGLGLVFSYQCAG